jgi:hypothetical protein
VRHGRLERLMGKVLFHLGSWVYRRDLHPDGLLRALDGFSLDRDVLEQLEADLVDLVHYRYAGDLYEAPLAAWRARAIPWDKGGRPQLVLPRAKFRLIPDYPQERIPETRRVTVVLSAP